MNIMTIFLLSDVSGMIIHFHYLAENQVYSVIYIVVYSVTVVYNHCLSILKRSFKNFEKMLNIYFLCITC